MSHDADLDELLRDSVRLRLRADVPVGTYLSGGLDSSLITALAQAETDHELRTFSIAFADPRYDERSHQEEVARAIGTRHHVVDAGPAEIAAAFPDVVRHAEMPLVRTAPVPLFLLAREVREQAITVVATGEGADELFWGYELFKEVAFREIHEHDPERAVELLEQLYSYLGPPWRRRGPAWRRFLLETGADDEELGSHLTRAEATATVKAFYRPEVAAEIGTSASLDRLRAELPPAFGSWSRLERAAWLEITTLARPLPACQRREIGWRWRMGSRAASRSSIIAFSRTPPACRPEAKLEGMREKVALRELAAEVLPPAIAERGKQPYRAPEVAPFFAPGAPGWVEELLSPAALARDGDLGPVAGGWPAEALPRRPGDRDARVDGAGRHPLHPAVASRSSSAGGPVTIRRSPSNRGSASTAPSNQRPRRLHDRDHQRRTGRTCVPTSRRTSSTCTRASSSRTATTS